MASVDPSLTSASTYTPAPEANEKSEPVKERPSMQAMVDSIEQVVVAQKPSSFQRKARVDTKISNLVPQFLKTYTILFKGLNAMAKIIVDAEMKRKTEEKRHEIHQLFLKATLEVNLRRKAKIKELVQSQALSPEQTLAAA